MLVLAAVVSAGAYARVDAEDRQLSAEVRRQIDAHPSLRFHNIVVHTYGHDVYLEGLIDTRLDRNEAADIARAVPGVHRVYNELAINNGA